MASEALPRPLLPQTTQQQTYSFAPQVLAPREPQQRSEPPRPSTVRNRWLTRLSADYVFVDEHNRHKRLKGTQSALSRLPLTPLTTPQ